MLNIVKNIKTSNNGLYNEILSSTKTVNVVVFLDINENKQRAHWKVT